MALAGFLIMNGYKPDSVVQDVMIGNHKKKWCFYFKNSDKLRKSMQVYYGAIKESEDKQIMLRHFSKVMDCLIGATVWIIDSHKCIKEIQINKRNIWRMKVLWEQDLLFFTLQDAEIYLKEE